MSTSRRTRTPRPTAKPTLPGPYHKGNVAEDLLAAVRRLIGTEGVESITVRRLCREVGVSPANFYNHYPSIEYLLLEVAAEGAEVLLATFDRLAKRHDSREDQLVGIAVQSVEFAVENPDLFQVMFGQVPGGPSHERYQRNIEACFGRLVRVIYGEERYRAEDAVWSYARCQKAYAFFAFNYGLARLISMGFLRFPNDARSKRQQFVREQAQQFIRGLDLVATPEP